MHRSMVGQPPLPGIMTMMNNEAGVGSGARRGRSTQQQHPHQSNCVPFLRPWAVGHGHGTHKTKKLCTLELERERERGTPRSSLLSFSFPLPNTPISLFIPPSSLSPSIFLSLSFDFKRTYPRLLVLARGPSRDMLVEWTGRGITKRKRVGSERSAGEGRKEAVSREFVRPPSYRESWLVAQGGTRPSTKRPGGGAHPSIHPSISFIPTARMREKKKELLFPPRDVTLCN